MMRQPGDYEEISVTVNTYPCPVISSTYCWLMVEGTEILRSDARRHPSYEELTVGVQFHVRPRRVWIEDSEILGLIVDGRGNRTFRHSYTRVRALHTRDCDK